jgi:hypothetical protein
METLCRILTIFVFCNCVLTRYIGEGKPLPTVESEENGDSRSTYERRTCLVHWACRAGTRDFYLVLALYLAQNLCCLLGSGATDLNKYGADPESTTYCLSPLEWKTLLSLRKLQNDCFVPSFKAGS